MNERCLAILLLILLAGTGDDPPAIYPRALSVGATNASDVLASLSSRGPALYLGQTLAKPEVSAPGVSVRSSIRGTGYATFQGTSMAGPHVAGADVGPVNVVGGQATGQDISLGTAARHPIW